MNAHELARILLAGPDLPVIAEGYDQHCMKVLRAEDKGTWRMASFGPAIVLRTTEEPTEALYGE